MLKETIDEFKFDGILVTVKLQVDKTHLSPGDILTVKATFSQKGKNLGYFVTSECAIATPVTGPLTILDTKSTNIPSNDDPKLSLECEEIKRFFSTFIHDAIVQASGVFILQDNKRHHILTDPLLIEVGKTKMQS
jgi:hypothetical protein